MGFCTVVNCMDGRVQEPVIEFLEKRFNCEYVDCITEPGPVKILAEHDDKQLLEHLTNMINISVNKHKSVSVSIVAHFDCAGNPLPEDKQKIQLESAVSYVSGLYPDIEVIGLWVGQDWKVTEVC